MLAYFENCSAKSMSSSVSVPSRCVNEALTSEKLGKEGHDVVLASTNVVVAELAREVERRVVDHDHPVAIIHPRSPHHFPLDLPPHVSHSLLLATPHRLPRPPSRRNHLLIVVQHIHSAPVPMTCWSLRVRRERRRASVGRSIGTERGTRAVRSGFRCVRAVHARRRVVVLAARQDTSSASSLHP